MDPSDRPRRPWLLGLLLIVITVGVVAALVTSEGSGTGATNVGQDGPETQAAVTTTPAEAQPRAETETTLPAPTGTTSASEAPAPRRCEATRSNPGGTNNYLPDAPPATSLGRGFVITGLVRGTDCRPLSGVRIQVWLATETGSERDNRASVRTGPDGRYRIETAPTIAQFGEPNIHVGYDDDRYEPVFIRRVVDLDDERAVVDLTLAGR